MKSALQLSRKAKDFIPTLKKSTRWMGGRELSSLVNMVSKTNPFLPLLFSIGGLQSLTQRNMGRSNRIMDDDEPIDPDPYKNMEDVAYPDVDHPVNEN